MKTISNLFSIENKKSTAIFLKILLLGLFAIMFMAIRPETVSARVQDLVYTGWSNKGTSEWGHSRATITLYDGVVQTGRYSNGTSSDSGLNEIPYSRFYKTNGTYNPFANTDSQFT